jgi:hypothetical protein
MQHDDFPVISRQKPANNAINPSLKPNATEVKNLHLLTYRSLIARDASKKYG